MAEQLLELRRLELVLAGSLLAAEPQHPVPEVVVDPAESVGARLPGRLLIVRLLGEDQVDLHRPPQDQHPALVLAQPVPLLHQRDRKSTRLNSSHMSISYAVFCLKKKKKNNQTRDNQIKKQKKKNKKKTREHN